MKVALVYFTFVTKNNPSLISSSSFFNSFWLELCIKTFSQDLIFINQPKMKWWMGIKKSLTVKTLFRSPSKGKCCDLWFLQLPYDIAFFIRPSIIFSSRLRNASNYYNNWRTAQGSPILTKCSLLLRPWWMGFRSPSSLMYLMICQDWCLEKAVRAAITTFHKLTLKTFASIASLRLIYESSHSKWVN